MTSETGGFLGADVDGLDRLAIRFSAAAETTNEVVAVLAPLVREPWGAGPFYDRFVTYVEGELKPTLSSLKQALDRFGSVVQAHADSQRQVSGGEGQRGEQIKLAQAGGGAVTISRDHGATLGRELTTQWSIQPGSYAPVEPGDTITEPDGDKWVFPEFLAGREVELEDGTTIGTGAPRAGSSFAGTQPAAPGDTITPSHGYAWQIPGSQQGNEIEFPDGSKVQVSGDDWDAQARVSFVETRSSTGSASFIRWRGEATVFPGDTIIQPNGVEWTVEKEQQGQTIRFPNGATIDVRGPDTEVRVTNPDGRSYSRVGGIVVYPGATVTEPYGHRWVVPGFLSGNKVHIPGGSTIHVERPAGTSP